MGGGGGGLLFFDAALARKVLVGAGPFCAALGFFQNSTALSAKTKRGPKLPFFEGIGGERREVMSRGVGDEENGMTFVEKLFSCVEE